MWYHLEGSPITMRLIQKSESEKMNREILMVAEAVSAEKGVPKTLSLRRLSWRWRQRTRKRYDEEADIQVSIDRESGDYVTKRSWLVMPDTELALLGTQFTTEEAAEVDTSLKPGDYHEERVEKRRLWPYRGADGEAGDCSARA